MMFTVIILCIYCNIKITKYQQIDRVQTDVEAVLYTYTGILPEAKPYQFSKFIVTIKSSIYLIGIIIFFS